MEDPYVAPPMERARVEQTQNLLVGEYLLKRLHELGLRSIFGVPGGRSNSLHKDTNHCRHLVI